MSSLSKWLKPVAAVAGVVAAPFTGGASLAVTAGMLSSMAQDSSQAQAQKAANAAADQQIQEQKKAQLEILDAQAKLSENATTKEMQTYYDQKISALQNQVASVSANTQQINSVQREPITMNTVQQAPNYTPYIIVGVLLVIGGLIWWFKFRK